MTRKLLQKAGLVQMPAVSRPAATTSSVDPARPKTAPGSMIHFMSAQSAAVEEAESLREKLADFDGAMPVRRIDPELIRVSIWSNRHPASFDEPSFVMLRAEIASAGGNVQPIKVRPVATSRPREGVGRSNPLDHSSGEAYEIVYGHRRHRACQELGLPVLALVENISEHRLFVEMERENRSRKDLSAWEQGCMYARALDKGLFPSNRQLAAAIGRDLGDIGKALALARLPQAVVDAFGSPLDLQYRWAKPLGEAQQRDPEGLIRRAQALKQPRRAPMSGKQVFDALVAADQGVGPSNPREDIVEIRDGATLLATVSDTPGHRLTILIDVALSPDRKHELIATVRKFLGN